MTALLQSLAEQTDFLRFSIQNRARIEGRILPKSYVKSIIFSSIACTNVGNLRQGVFYPGVICSEAKFFFSRPGVQTCIRIQEMQKLLFYLVRFKIYSQKTKYDSFLGQFSKS